MSNFAIGLNQHVSPLPYKFLNNSEFKVDVTGSTQIGSGFSKQPVVPVQAERVSGWHESIFNQDPQEFLSMSSPRTENFNIMLQGTQIPPF
jgi:hypothetical protein